MLLDFFLKAEQEWNMYFDQTIRFNEDQTDSGKATTVSQESTEHQQNSIDYFHHLNQDLIIYMPPDFLQSPTPSRHKRSFSFTSASSGKN